MHYSIKKNDYFCTDLYLSHNREILSSDLPYAIYSGGLEEGDPMMV